MSSQTMHLFPFTSPTNENSPSVDPAVVDVLLWGLFEMNAMGILTLVSFSMHDLKPTARATCPSCGATQMMSVGVAVPFCAERRRCEAHF